MAYKILVHKSSHRLMAMSIESELLDATHDYVTKKNDLVAWKVYQIRKQNNFKRSTEKKKKKKKYTNRYSITYQLTDFLLGGHG